MSIIDSDAAFGPLAEALNRITAALPDDAGLIYDELDAVYDAWVAERRRADALATDLSEARRDAVTWGHVTRARQRGNAEAALRAEAVLRRAAAELSHAADKLQP